MELFLIVGGLIHLMLVTTCFMVSQDAFRNLDHKRVVYGLIVLLPIVNVIMTMMLMDISLRATLRNLRYKIDDCNRAERNLESLKLDYADLERKKLRKVRVGDRFRVPDTSEWKDGFRNTECVIIELGDEIIVNNKLSPTRWSVKWHHLKYMVFLSDEPIKPFEFKK